MSGSLIAWFDSFPATPYTPCVQHEVAEGDKHVEKLVEGLSDSQRSHQLDGEGNLVDVIDGQQLAWF